MDINYLLFLGAIVLSALLYNGRRGKPRINYDAKSKRGFLVICGFIIFFMIAFRSIYNGSTDTMRYSESWEKLSKIHFKGLDEYFEDTTMEPFYVYTVWFLSKFLLNPRWLFVLTGALFSISVCRFAYKNCEDVFLGIYVFVTMGLFNFMVQGLRQAIAMSICLFAFEYAKKRRAIMFTVLVLIALLYHKGAIVFFVAYFLYGIKFTRKNIAGVSFVLFLVSMASSVLMTWGNDVFERNYSSTAQSGGLVTVIIYLLIIFLAVFFTAEKKEDPNFVYFFYVTLFAFVLFASRYFAADILERMSFFFAFGQMVMLPAIANSFKGDQRRLVTGMLIIVLTLYGIYKFSTTGLAPYNFMWQSGSVLA